MNVIRNTALLLPLTLGLATPAATAQFKLGGNLLGNFNLNQTQSRSGSHTRTVGNSWLGASLVATSGMSTTRGPNYESSRTDSRLTGVGMILTRSAEIGHIQTSATNTMAAGTQTRNASIQVRILGVNWNQGSNAGGMPFLKAGLNLKLFPTDISKTIGVGPFGVSVGGNCGVSVKAAGGFQLAVNEPTVRMTLAGYTSAYASLKAGLKVPGAGVSLNFKGAIGTQHLDVSCGASTRTGFTGNAFYSLTPVSIKVVLHAWIAWYDYYNDLIDFSLLGFSKQLF